MVGVQQRREALGEPVAVTPDVGVVVERVADRHAVAEYVVQAGPRRVREGRHGQPGLVREVGQQRRLAPGAARRGDLDAREGTVHVQELQGLEQCLDVVDAADPEATEQRVDQDVRVGQRAGMAQRHLRAELGGPGLERHDRDAPPESLDGDPGEAGDLGDLLETQPDRRDPRVVQHRLHQVDHAGHRAVADGHQGGDRERALLHGEVLGDVAALRDEGDAAVDADPALLLGPQGGAVEVVDEAQAVRPHESHRAGRRDQVALQPGTLLAGLGVPRGVADHAADAEPGELADHVDGPLAVDRHEGRVGYAGQQRQVGDAGDPAELLAVRVDRPEVPGVPDRPALLDGDLGRAAADHHQAAGVEETLQLAAWAVGHVRLRRPAVAAASG